MIRTADAIRGIEKQSNVKSRKLIELVALLLPLVAFGQTAPPAHPFQRLDGCVYKPQRWNDGDSFHVVLPDQKEIVFRLYGGMRLVEP